MPNGTNGLYDGAIRHQAMPVNQSGFGKTIPCSTDTGMQTSTPNQAIPYTVLKSSKSNEIYTYGVLRSMMICSDRPSKVGTYIRHEALGHMIRLLTDERDGLYKSDDYIPSIDDLGEEYKLTMNHIISREG